MHSSRRIPYAINCATQPTGFANLLVPGGAAVLALRNGLRFSTLRLTPAIPLAEHRSLPIPGRLRCDVAGRCV